MPRPYAADLRQRALRACEHGRLSRARIAALFGLGETTLYRWQQQARVEGRREAKPHAGGPPPRLDGKALDALRALVAGANALTLAEYAVRLAERPGVRVSVPTVCQALKRLGLVRKKPSAPRSGTGPSSPTSGRRGAPLDRAAIKGPRSTRGASSSWTRAASTPG
jgi:transposase